jgi:hypothetical protein
MVFNKRLDLFFMEIMGFVLFQLCCCLSTTRNGFFHECGRTFNIENVGNVVLSEWFAELKDKKTKARVTASSFLYICGTCAHVLALSLEKN